MKPWAVESSSVGPSWSCSHNKLLWSRSIAAQRPLKAAHNLKREKEKKHFITSSCAQPSIKTFFWARVSHYQNKWPCTCAIMHTYTGTDWWICDRWVILQGWLVFSPDLNCCSHRDIKVNTFFIINFSMPNFLFWSFNNEENLHV